MSIDAALAYAREKGFELYLLFGATPGSRQRAKAVLRHIAKSKANGYYRDYDQRNSFCHHAHGATEAEAIRNAVDDPDWPMSASKYESLKAERRATINTSIADLDL
jgi:hypothetical protein